MTQFESRRVALDDFPREQAAALRRIHDHVGGNLCIQLAYRNAEDCGTRENIHVYFSVSDPSSVDVPQGLDETRDNITLHFNKTPSALRYRGYITEGDLRFPQGVSRVHLSDCRVGGNIVLGRDTLLTLDWSECTPRPISVLTC